MSIPPVSRAVLLAAGRGKRLGNLTADRPKPMIPVGGTPVLEHILVGLRNAGIREFLIVVGYRADQIQEHFGDGSRREVRIEYIHQPAPNGTGAALALAKDFAAEQPFLMSYGDILTDYSHYRLLLEDYARRPCPALLGINPVEDPTAGGAVYREGDCVVRVEEKPPEGASASPWNLAGINVFGSDVFPALDSITPSPRGEYEVTDAISVLIESGREVRACELRSFWSDIGSLEAVAAANRTWKNVLD